MVVDLTNRYKINEEKGIVKYTLKAHGFYYTGVAKTNFEEGDVFDLEKGKRIAKLRAILKMKRAFLKEALAIQEVMREIISQEEDLQNHIQALTQSAANVEEKLNEVLGVRIEDEDVQP
jgi:hypothetical protein